MKTDLAKLMIAGVVSLGAAGLASADSVGLDIVNGSVASGTDISVSIEETSVSIYDFAFVITNNSTSSAAVTGIYVDEGWDVGEMLKGSYASLRSDDDVSFTERKRDADGIASWTGSMASFESNGSDLSNGIDAGESVRILVAADRSGPTLADMQAALGSAGFNIGLRIQDMFGNDAWALVTQGNGIAGPPTDGGDQGEVSGAPTPTAAAAGLALLAIAGYRRRRDG